MHIFVAQLFTVSDQGPNVCGVESRQLYRIIDLYTILL